MHWVCPHPLKHEEHTPAIAEEMQKTKAGPVQEDKVVTIKR